MVRVSPFLLLLTLAATPAAAEDVATTDAWRIHETTNTPADRQLPAVNVGGVGRFGFGMFGLKSQTPRNRAVIGHEITAPRQRRAGLGFSLKF